MGKIGTFGDFCSEFGYDLDSIAAKKTYKKVKKQNLKFETFYDSFELNLLQQIH